MVRPYWVKWIADENKQGWLNSMGIYLFFRSWVGGIQQILQSDWFLDRRNPVIRAATVQRAESFDQGGISALIELIYFRERISGYCQFFANSSLSLLTLRWQGKWENSIKFSEVVSVCLVALAQRCNGAYSCLSLSLCTILSENWVNFSRIYLSDIHAYQLTFSKSYKRPSLFEQQSIAELTFTHTRRERVALL